MKLLRWAEAGAEVVVRVDVEVDAEAEVAEAEAEVTEAAEENVAIIHETRTNYRASQYQH